MSLESIAHRSMLAEQYFRAGKYDACRQLILEMQREGIDTPLGRLGLAMLDFIEKRFDSALEHLGRAEAMERRSARVLELIGRLYLRLRRMVEGSRALDEAISNEPGLASAYVGRAIAYLLAQEPAAAEPELREALRLAPNSFEAHYHLGVALSRQRRHDEAIESFKAAVAASPAAANSAHRRLADLLERRGAAALALHHRALAQLPATSGRPAAFDLEWFRQGLAT